MKEHIIKINEKSKKAFSLLKSPDLNSKEHYVHGFIKGGLKEIIKHHLALMIKMQVMILIIKL